MSREIKKRKKRFWALCLAFVFALLQTGAGTVFASDYMVVFEDSNNGTLGTEIVKPGDKVIFDYRVGYSANPVKINYYDKDGTTSFSDITATYTNSTDTAGVSFTIASYPETGTLSQEEFKGWKVDKVYGSSGYLYYINLSAVAYTKSNISYNLDGGTVSIANPTTYYEGKEEIILNNPTKENYDFEGWYTEYSFTNKITSITIDMAGDLTLYAKFSPKEFDITYHNVEGATNPNPTTYTYGGGLDSFADASKTGYTFNGWYSDVELKVPITGISGSQSGTVNIYAKFTPNTYGITYNLNGGTNGAGNPSTYVYNGEMVTLADASKTGYAFDGWYIDNGDGTYNIKITDIPTDTLGGITLYAKYTKIKKTGVGSVIVTDVNYGRLPMPVIASSTNGTDKATIEYKKKNASDTTYTTTKPTNVGEYTVRVTFPETEDYKQLIATCNFAINYLKAPEVPYSLDGKTGEENYYTSAVTIVPPAGYLVSDKLDGEYSDKLEIKESTDGLLVYLKKTNTGEKTSGIKVSEIKIDKTAPVIQNAASGDTIYGDSAEIIVKDDNLKEILVNGESVEFENGKATLQLDSNNGEERYEIICVDIAGNKSEIKLVVSADWMKTRLIPLNETVKLLKEYSYSLGGGKWKVFGDSTVYAGNTSFYVTSDGEYTFSQEK